MSVRHSSLVVALVALAALSGVASAQYTSPGPTGGGSCRPVLQPESPWTQSRWTSLMRGGWVMPIWSRPLFTPIATITASRMPSGFAIWRRDTW